MNMFFVALCVSPKCFMGTEMDVLAVGNYVLYKEQQNEALKENYEERYELD